MVVMTIPFTHRVLWKTERVMFNERFGCDQNLQRTGSYHREPRVLSTVLPSYPQYMPSYPQRVDGDGIAIPISALCALALPQDWACGYVLNAVDKVLLPSLGPSAPQWVLLYKFCRNVKMSRRRLVSSSINSAMRSYPWSTVV